PTTYLVDTTLSNSSDSDQTVQAVRLLLLCWVMLFSQVLSTQTSILKVMTVMPMAYWTPMVAGLMTHLMLMN
ncbi:hypothetical protein, partial [Escherichia coli]|uniref:hypothetical protein n=1 Tax=Escherichia coli TaxID=562 RepID=UPI003D0FBBF8